MRIMDATVFIPGVKGKRFVLKKTLVRYKGETHVSWSVVDRKDGQELISSSSKKMATGFLRWNMPVVRPIDHKRVLEQFAQKNGLLRCVQIVKGHPGDVPYYLRPSVGPEAKMDEPCTVACDFDEWENLRGPVRLTCDFPRSTSSQHSSSLEHYFSFSVHDHSLVDFVIHKRLRIPRSKRLTLEQIILAQKEAA
jgi:hypothetical protein